MMCDEAERISEEAAAFANNPENADYMETDFESLKSRAEKLSKDSPTGEIDAILQDSCGIGSIARRKIREIIKQKTGISYGDQKKAQAEFSGKAEPDHLTAARSVLKAMGEKNILATVAHVWFWDACGKWRTVSDRELKQLVQRTLEGNMEDIMRSLVDGVTDVLKSEIFRAEHQWNRSQDVINILNGELFYDGTAWVLRAHCREHYLTTQIPVFYDPLAKCPRFELFLREIFEGDPDAEDKGRALLEMIGYSLTCDTRYERFVILIGIGANGKSVVLEVVRLLVGQDNAAAVQPSQFGNNSNGRICT
jgi:putative DNA primase/helicase